MRYFSAILLTAVVSPALLCAQFQAPTGDELKMTSDAKAPGAAAVYLNLDENTNDPQHYYTFYARIKVLTEAGEKLARVEIPAHLGDASATGFHPKYMGQDWATSLRASEGGKGSGASAAPTIFKVQSIQARTIHADGTVVPLTLGREDLEQLNAAAAEGKPMTFTLPGVEVGSILEYRYEIGYGDTHYSSPFWRVQRPYFVHKAHFSFTPFNDFLAGDQQMTSNYLLDSNGKVVNTVIGWPVLPAGVSVKSGNTGQFTLDISDVPALPQEEWMPPLDTYAYQVRFYYKNASNQSEFWSEEEKRWTKEVDRFTETTPSMVQAVNSVVAGSDGPLDKAKKLYAAVQGFANTSFLGSSAAVKLQQPAAASAAEVWSRKSGTSHELALLYLGLLRAAGIPAWDMAVVDRDKGVFSRGYLSFDQFDGDVVIADFAGKDVYLDPGQKMCPFQMLDWKHAGASGIRQTAGGTEVSTVPLLPYNANTTLRTGNLTLEGSGKVTGFLRVILTGQEAIYWRQLALREGEAQAKTSFGEWLGGQVPAGVQVQLDRLEGLDDPELNLVAMAEAQGTLGTGSGSIPAYFFAVRKGEPFVGEAQRAEPIDMHYGERMTDQVVYHLPSGATVASAPEADKASLPPYAAFGTAIKTEDGQVTVTRELVRGFTLAGTSQYAELRGFYERVDAADRKQIKLGGASAASN